MNACPKTNAYFANWPAKIQQRSRYPTTPRLASLTTFPERC